MTFGVAMTAAFANFTVFSHGVSASTPSTSWRVTASGMPVDDSTALAEASAAFVVATGTTVVGGDVVVGATVVDVGTTVGTWALSKRGRAVPHAASTHSTPATTTRARMTCGFTPIAGWQ